MRYYARDPQNYAQTFYNAWFATTYVLTFLANFGFVMYQKWLVHVIMVFKHYVSCIMRIEAPRGHSDTSVNSELCI